MSSLGELFFTLGLDDKKFNDAIEAAKKKIKELGADVEIGVKLDLEGIKKEIQNAVKAASGGNLEVGAKVKVDGLENLRSMLEASKKEAKELEDAIANASAASVKVQKQSELESVRKRIANQEAQIKSKSANDGTATTTPLKVALDQDSVNIVQAQLAKLGEPITAKISVEYDLEKFQAVETAMKNFGSRINQAINAGLPQGSTPIPSNTGKQKGVAGWFDKVSETLFGDSADGGGYSTPAASAANISQVSSALGTLSKEIEALGKATEKISKRASGKKSVVSDEEAEMRKYYSQLQRLEEGVRRWQNVKAKIESSKIDKNSDNYKQAIRLIDDYINKLVEAQTQAGKFSNRELAGMLGQTASGEIAKTGRLIAQQKSDEQAIRNNLAREQAQIQRLEEGVKRVQNVIAKLNATDVDKSGAGYKQAISLLNGYIDKLNTAKKNAGNFTKREMAGMLGQTLGGEIAEAERLVAAQRKMEKAKTKTAKSVAQAEKEELQLKREKIKLQKEEANLGKARANQKKAELQKEKEAVRLKKERVSLQKKLGKAAGNVGNWASQLGNQLGNYISIYSIEQFVRNLYTIGGEFQKQQIALRNMLGDVDKGNAIFERMKGLAVKSPFTFSELASYTKQMSAYGIEYENLYDTTKRLADISAGVGVDMGRLILAFGQVRSAAVLRGQELRQFTEAGIPLVNELAKKFSELEHRAVSAGEVFEKISKREVSFGMVKDILFDMTDPGGKFFQTQEQLAESLAGKWSNLKDAWDIMMADIANGNNTALKGLAETLTWIVSHWEKFAPLVMGAVVALGAYRSIMTLLIPLQAAFFATTNLAPWVGIATILGGAAIAVAGYIDEAETALELSERLNTAAQKAESENTDKLNTASRYLDILKQQAGIEEDKYALYQKQLKTFEELVKLYPKQMEGIEFEKLTLQEIENIRKRIAEQTKSDTLASYDKNINEALLAYTLERQRMAVKANVAGLTIDDYSEKEKKNLTDLYNVYTGLMNAKEEYEQSLLDKNKPVALENWQEVAKKMADEYAKSKIYFKDPAAEHDIYAYFDHLEEVFKDAKSKYDRATDESLRKPQRAIMNAANAINMAIGGRNLNYKEIRKKDKEADKKEAERRAKEIAQAFADGVREELNRISSQWDLYKQLFETTGDKAFAMTAFDITPVWDEAAEQMKKHLEDAMSEKGIEDALEFNIPDNLGKVLYGDLYDSWKAIKDRIEKNGIDLKVNTANAIKDAKDFEMQVEEIERELHEKLERIGKSGLSADIIGRLTQSLIGQSERAISSLEFDKFKKEVGYTQFFANLEHQGVHSILAMRDAMLKFGDSTNLTLEEMKQLADDIERMMDVLVKKHPFKAIDIAALAWGELRQVYKTAKENFEKNPSFANATSLAKAKAALDEADGMMSEAAKNIQSKFENLSGVVSDLSSMFERLGSTSLKHFAEELESISSGMNTGSGVGNYIGGLFGRGGAGSIVGGFIGAAVGAMAGLADAGRKAVEAEQERSQIVIDRLEKVASLLKDRIAESLTGLYNSTLDATSKIELQRKKAEYEEAAKELQGQGPIDPNAWYGISYDTTTFPWDTNDYLVYSKKTHEAIERAIDMDNEYMAVYASLLAQRDEMVYQQATYTDKDSDKVEAFKRDKNLEIEKLNAEIEKLTKDMMSSLYSIDFKDWASQLTDSIVNAWARGEDAAKAYESTVSDILRNVATSMIQQKIIGDYFEKNINPFVEDFIASGGVMTDELYYKLAGIVDGGMERIEQAEDALDAWEKVLNEKGLTLKDLSDDTTKSGLSKGIQSVTEDTADLLASYINSMRADLSMNRTLIEQLVSVDVPKMSYLAEAQLQQLQMIVSNTSKNVAFVGEIRDLFNRIIDKGSNKLRI